MAIYLNKLIRIQRLLPLSTSQSSSNLYYAGNLFFEKQMHSNAIETNSSAQSLPKSIKTSQQPISGRQYSTKKTSDISAGSAGGGGGGGGTGVRSASITTSVDEFRAREELREADYERDEAEKEKKRNVDEEEEAKRAKIESIRIKILEAALPHVSTLGWSRKAIVQGAEDIGLPSVVHGMFTEGGFALVSYFYGKCNEELVQRLQAETLNGTKEIGNPIDFLVLAVQKRLEMIIPYKSQWPQAMALIALPQNASTSLAQLLTLVDDICYYSGDRSVDFGWYTRRIGLATIMKMTELYMLQDKSPDHTKTWEFLRNRMDEAVQIQMVLAQTGNVTNSFQRSFNSAFVTARNILGLGYNRR